ncbi:hypothetical protein KQX54_017517 [Cotesia glomerata]|uniref:Uncharacterized protein n=1 Tax=Cotesia glomerata TaxID=32391 RepID=A0AAV7IXJ8_COTGL|nr:hypothetical protein KQX54_017517 [Cotesia glomerata]
MALMLTFSPSMKSCLLIPSNPGNTPLHLAILNQDIEAVKKLLEEGADLTTENENHQNPLQIAVNLNVQYNEVVYVLINHVSEDNITEEVYTKFLYDLLDHRLNTYAEKLLGKCLTFNINLSYPTPTSNCLWTAVKNDSVYVVEKMLKRGVNINYSHSDDGDYRTALHIACEHNESLIGEFLLANGAAESFNDKWPFNNRKLSLNLCDSAIATGHNKIVVALLDHGIDVNSRLPSFILKPSLLHRAVEENNREIIELLVSKGANVNIKDHLGLQPISECTGHKDSYIIDFLIGNKELSCNYKTFTKLTTHYLLNNPEKVKALLRNLEQFGSLMTKARFGKEFLNCDHFYNFFFKENYRQGFDCYLGVFVVYGLDVNIRPKSGWSVIHSNFLARCTYRAHILLKYGADINSKCDKGLTPIDCFFNEESEETNDSSLKFRRFVSYFSQHLFKMRLVGQFVDEKDYQRVMEKVKNPYWFEEKYKKEIAKMKATVINHYVTYLDIVQADLYQLVIFLKDPVIFRPLASGKYKSEFPEFQIIISGCFFRAYIRKRLLDEVSRCTIFNIINKLPYPCIRPIMDNFSNQDLRELNNQFRLLRRPRQEVK